MPARVGLGQRIQRRLRVSRNDASLCWDADTNGPHEANQCGNVVVGARSGIGNGAVLFFADLSVSGGVPLNSVSSTSALWVVPIDVSPDGTTALYRATTSTSTIQSRVALATGTIT